MCEPYDKTTIIRVYGVHQIDQFGGRKRERKREKREFSFNGIKGFSEGEGEEFEGIEGTRRPNRVRVSEGVDNMGDAKSEGHHSLRFHPYGHHHRYEL